MRFNDKKQLNDLRERLQFTLSNLGDKLDIAIQVGKCTYDAGGAFAGWQITTSNVSDEGVAETKEREAFRQLASLYGLKADDLDRTFRDGRETYRVNGLNTRKSKNPVLCVRERDGKTYCFRAVVVASLLK